VTAQPPPSDEAIAPGPSYDPRLALAAGEWDSFLAVADGLLAEPARTGDVDPQLRAVRAWLRALRGDIAGALADVDLALTTARASGFWRLTWTALAHGALAYALLDDGGRSEALLAELRDGWRRMRTIAGGDWVPAAGHAVTRLGPAAALHLRDALAETPHHTAWTRAALASVNGTLASGQADHRGAAAHHLDAAQRYAEAGSATDRAFAMVAAGAALAAAGDPRAEAVLGDARAFAVRNQVQAG
jgi:hypothetical protein